MMTLFQLQRWWWNKSGVFWWFLTISEWNLRPILNYIIHLWVDKYMEWWMWCRVILHLFMYLSLQTYLTSSFCRLADTPDSASPHLSHGREHPRRRLRERITQRREEDAPGSLSRESADTVSACPVRMKSSGSVSNSLWPLQNRITVRNVRFFQLWKLV